jgi:hypothetical protein
MIVLYTTCEGGRFSMLKTKLKGKRLLKFLKRPTSGIYSFHLPNGSYWYRGLTSNLAIKIARKLNSKKGMKEFKEKYKDRLKYLTDPIYKKEIDDKYKKYLSGEYI